MDSKITDNMVASFLHATPQVKEFVNKIGGLENAVTANYDRLSNSYTWDSSENPGTKLRYDMTHNNWQTAIDPMATTIGEWKVGMSVVGTDDPVYKYNNIKDLLNQTANRLNNEANAEQKKLQRRNEVDKIFSDLKEYVRNIDRGWEASETLENFFTHLRKTAQKTAQKTVSAA